MQRRQFPVARLPLGFLLLAATVACGGGADTAPADGSVAVTMSRSRVSLGSPIEMTYRFTLAPDAPPLGSRKVFVQFLDANDEMMWKGAIPWMLRPRTAARL